MSLEQANLPEPTGRVVRNFVEAARAALGSDLRAIVLFGSAAEGRLRPTSDVNIIVVLSAFEPDKVDQLREPLRTAHAAARLDAMFLLEGEISAAVDAFAVKFADILHRRKLLFGSDPFVGVTLSRRAEIARLKQVLLNLTLRLRQQYLLQSLRDEQAVLAVADAAGPLRACAAALLDLQSMPASSPKEALENIVASLPGNDWKETLEHVSAARENRLLAPGLAGPTLLRLIDRHLDRIDVVEVIADDYFGASRRKLRSLQTLAAQVPVVLHGVSLGLASASPVDVSRVDRIARVVDAVRPQFWSEHLAFVRSHGVEIGHLAAPPRTDATIEGSARNLDLAAAVVGSRPLVENVATLIDPPGSTHDEASWISKILWASSSGLLLDLNNLHANATNFGYDPLDVFDRIPFDRVAAVHLAGGKWIRASTGEQRLLDDHLHDVPEEVFRLLTEVGARAKGPLTVILERDGAYPPFAALVKELDHARHALAAGRARSAAETLTRMSASRPAPTSREHQTAPAFEAYLARLYVDENARAAFLADPRDNAARAGLAPAECEAVAGLDRVGLELAADSFERKRQAKVSPEAGGRPRSSAHLEASRVGAGHGR